MLFLYGVRSPVCIFLPVILVLCLMFNDTLLYRILSPEVLQIWFPLPKIFENSSLLNPGCGQPEILFLCVFFYLVREETWNSWSTDLTSRQPLPLYTLQQVFSNKHLHYCYELKFYTEKTSPTLTIRFYAPHILHTSDHVATRKKIWANIISIWIWHSEERASWYILTIKSNKMHYFSTLFW